MNKFFALFLLLPVISFGQTTLIPDVHFEQKLIDLGYDSGEPDGEVLTENISGITTLNIYGINIAVGDISDLTGIEDFESLTYLNCSWNEIQTIDVSQNAQLTHLHCSYNFIPELDLTNNASLTTLTCGDNNLAELDLSGNLALDTLQCRRNNLTGLNMSSNPELIFLECVGQIQASFTSLDLSSNPKLKLLRAAYNDLSTLDLSNNPELTILEVFTNELTELNLANGNNENMESMVITFNPELTCVTVDDEVWATENWTVDNGNIAEGTFFSEGCMASSILEFEEKATINIYPNPTSGAVQFSLPENFVGEVYLVNALGEILLQKHVRESQVSIDLKRFGSGMYSLKLVNSRSGQYFSEKLVCR